MHTTSLITLALAGLALAKPGAPPAVPIPLSDDPALCLKRLETFPNRSPNRFDVLGGRCLQARTYKGKFGPYNGDFFFETCCTDSSNQFGEPTYVNIDECVVFEPQNGTLIWNSQNSHKIRDHCKQCEVVMQGAGKNPGPYLSCSCEKSDKKPVRATIFLGGDADDAKNPKDSFWVTDEGRIVCKK
ncbi:hypothetical protein EsH8_IX_000088 [Colletotrichum jinshuiense]